MVNWWRELGCCYHFECIWKSLFHFVVAVKAPLMVNWWREVGRQILYGDTESSWIYPYSLASLVQQLAISCKRSWLLRWLPSISSNFWVDPILFSVYLQTKNPCTLFINGFGTICMEFYEVAKNALLLIVALRIYSFFNSACTDIE